MGLFLCQEEVSFLEQGILDVSDSTWTLGDNFTKTSGTLTMSGNKLGIG